MDFPKLADRPFNQGSEGSFIGSDKKYWENILCN